MKASEFVECLKGISVRIDLLKKQGVSDQFIEDRKRSYLAVYKGGRSVSQYPLVELLENYDCSKLEIGMITFGETSFTIMLKIKCDKNIYESI